MDIVYLHAQADQEAALLESQVPTIVTLTKGCNSAKVVREMKDIPAGCGSAIISHTLAVHTLVRVGGTFISVDQLKFYVFFRALWTWTWR